MYLSYKVTHTLIQPINKFKSHWGNFIFHITKVSLFSFEVLNLSDTNNMLWLIPIFPNKIIPLGICQKQRWFMAARILISSHSGDLQLSYLPHPPTHQTEDRVLHCPIHTFFFIQ